MSVVNVSKRNGEIELWRFIVAVGIVLYHSGCFLGWDNGIVARCGYLGVEFFFLISGYFWACSLSRQSREISIVNLLIRKVKGFYPELFLSLILAWLYQLMIDPTFHFTLRACINSVIDDFLLFQSTHIVGWSGINGPEWYLSSLLFAGALLAVFYVNIRSRLLLLILSLSLMGWVIMEYGNIPAAPFKLFYVAYLGDIRALYAMGLGMCLPSLVKRLQSLLFNRWQKFILSLVRYALAGVIVLCLMLGQGREYGGVVVLLMCAFLILVLSRQCSDSNFYNRPLLLFLGRISLPLFLCNAYLAYHWKLVIGDNATSLFLLVTYLIATAVDMAIVMGGAALIRKYCSWFRK